LPLGLKGRVYQIDWVSCARGNAAYIGASTDPDVALLAPSSSPRVEGYPVALASGRVRVVADDEKRMSDGILALASSAALVDSSLVLDKVGANLEHHRDRPSKADSPEQLNLVVTLDSFVAIDAHRLNAVHSVIEETLCVLLPGVSLLRRYAPSLPQLLVNITWGDCFDAIECLLPAKPLNLAVLDLIGSFEPGHGHMKNTSTLLTLVDNSQGDSLLTPVPRTLKDWQVRIKLRCITWTLIEALVGSCRQDS